MKKVVLVVTLLALFLFTATLATAGVSPEEAARLKTTLTPFGAEKAGNADGTIPEWTGGLSKIPAGINYQPGQYYPDPFKDDKPLYSITAKNLAQYADKVTPGQQALLKKYPDYRLDVYRTRRTFAAPAWVYENTYQNALRAELSKDGLGVKEVYCGIPFPLPKNGNEMIFNHLCRWTGASRTGPYVAGVVLPNGTFTPAGGGDVQENYPFYIKDGTYKNFNGEIWNLLVVYQRPERRKGELLLVRDPLNQARDKRKAWQYFPGQRRVRRAPTVAYDTPDGDTGGLATYDDAYLFNGAIDRFNWKIIGKKEMYIPYNCLKYHNASIKEVTGKGHHNPDEVRWELHRVWVLESTLRKGARHIYSKRVYYLDEDSWIITLDECYDGRGALWRTSVGFSWPHYSVPGNFLVTVLHYDLQKDFYAMDAALNGLGRYLVYNVSEGIPADHFTPRYMRKQGRR